MLISNGQTISQFNNASISEPSDILCGQVVRGNVTLTSNLDCTGDGLIVGEDNTIINLNGFSITGTGQNSEKVGIAVPHANDVFIQGPGTVRNFQAGILITGGSASSSSGAVKETSQNHFVDKSGYVHVVGEIQNVAGTTINFVKVNVAYYDSQNQIIGTDFVYSSPDTLSAGQTATYNVLTSPDSLASPDVNIIKTSYEYEIDGETSSSNGNDSPGPPGASNTTITYIGFEGNKIAVFQTNAQDSILNSNNITLNNIGIASHTSSGPKIHANNLTSNELAGITVVNTDSSLIDGNSIVGSRNGIFLDSQSSNNMVTNNTVQHNDIDINNADGLPLSINSNEVQGNDCYVSQPSGGCNLT
jgi:parallel beta-helix repeat protein